MQQTGKTFIFSLNATEVTSRKTKKSDICLYFWNAYMATKLTKFQIPPNPSALQICAEFSVSPHRSGRDGFDCWSTWFCSNIGVLGGRGLFFFLIYHLFFLCHRNWHKLIYIFQEFRYAYHITAGGLHFVLFRFFF